MTQLQELVDSLPKSGNESAHRRLEYFYISKLPLEWELQGSLADAFSSLGANSSALDIYLRLQMWDRVISCYQLLEMKHKVIFVLSIIVLLLNEAFFFNRRKILFGKSWPKVKPPNFGAYSATARMMSSSTKKLGKCRNIPVPVLRETGLTTITTRRNTLNAFRISKNLWPSIVFKRAFGSDWLSQLWKLRTGKQPLEPTVVTVP